MSVDFGEIKKCKYIFVYSDFEQTIYSHIVFRLRITRRTP